MISRFSKILILSVAAFAAFSSALHAANEATTQSVQGTVEFAAPGSTTFAALAKGQKLAIGSTIRTGDKSEAIVVLVPGAAIRVGPKSQMVLEDMAYTKQGETIPTRKAHIELKSGTVSALINSKDSTKDGKKKYTETDFVIKTPQGAAAARGTFYAVTVENGKTYVAVKEGKVGTRKTAPAAKAKATAKKPDEKI